MDAPVSWHNAVLLDPFVLDYQVEKLMEEYVGYRWSVSVHPHGGHVPVCVHADRQVRPLQRCRGSRPEREEKQQNKNGQHYLFHVKHPLLSRILGAAYSTSRTLTLLLSGLSFS